MFKLLAELDELKDAAKMPMLLAKIADIYGLKSVAYLGVGLTDRPDQEPYLAVTYSPEWVERYKTEHYVDIDPTIQTGLRRILPIDWGEFARESKKVRRLFGEAVEFGLGRRGISFPIHGRCGDRALVSISTDLSDRDWQHLRFPYMRDFHVLAAHMHQAILRLEGDPVAEGATLSPRERECLLWIAAGKTYWETAMILGLSEHTVRCYLETARHKLGAANTTHAVNKAVKASLLRQLP